MGWNLASYPNTDTNNAVTVHAEGEMTIWSWQDGARRVRFRTGDKERYAKEFVDFASEYRATEAHARGEKQK